MSLDIALRIAEALKVGMIYMGFFIGFGIAVAGLYIGCAIKESNKSK